MVRSTWRGVVRRRDVVVRENICLRGGYYGKMTLRSESFTFSLASSSALMVPHFAQFVHLWLYCSHAKNGISILCS